MDWVSVGLPLSSLIAGSLEREVDGPTRFLDCRPRKTIPDRYLVLKRGDNILLAYHSGESEGYL